jgi:N-acetylglutamate synthase-like GNAT family acetyltransferase
MAQLLGKANGPAAWIFMAVLTFCRCQVNLYASMSAPNLRVRRATTDDFQSLRSLWKSMHLPANELEKRLTEFQVIETADGQIAGAIGVQIIRQHALLHSEGYTDFSVADAARELFWERIQTIAAHHGVFRLWTQENSPFWARWGFQPANDETLARLPEEWKRSGEQWLTFQLKDEEAIATADKELAQFRESEKKRTAETLEQARTMTKTITVIAFILGIILISAAFFLLMRRNPFLPPR